MKKELKELLLKDLCAKLPYGVKILHEGWNYEWDDSLSTIERVVGIDELFVYTKVIDTHTGEEYREDKHTLSLFDDRLYLRPLSSMTEEEMDKVEEIMQVDTNHSVIFDFMANGDIAFQKANISIERFGLLIDYFNKQMLDWRGLIDKRLAIAVTEENNPYKE